MLSAKIECVNDVNNSFNASVTGSTVKVNGTDGVSVKADSKTVMVALAAGSSVSVSSGGLVTVDVAGSGVAFVREIADYCGIHADVPVFAIGGITPENIGLVKEAGANGGCMMSYMMSI